MKNSNLNLRDLAMEVTRKNIVKSSTKENINDSLVRILYEGKKKMNRHELITEITMDRLIAQHGEEELEKIAKDNRPEFDKMVKETSKTVKNGLDTSWSRSNNNSSFHFNEKYKHLELKRNGDTFSIVERKPVEKKADSTKK